MCHLLARFGVLAAGLVLAVIGCVGDALAGEVKGLSLQQGPTGTRAEVQLHGAGQFKTLSLSGPHRLVLDLPESHAAAGLKLPAPAGLVTNVRTGQPVPGTYRIVFELAAPVASLPVRAEPTPEGARLVIEWPGDGPVTPATAASPSGPGPATVAAAPAATASGSGDTPAPASDAAARAEAARATALLTAQVVQAGRASEPAPQPAQPAPAAVSPQAILEGRAGALAGTPAPATTTPATPATDNAPPPAATPAPAPVRPAVNAAAARPLIVAIDAGHGGQDPGAIGPTGKREKDVTLAMARELARQIDATPGLKSFLVRDSDVFIPLPMRAQRARAAKADIFISIHADAAENRNARGSSVYVLSTKGASSQRARWLADKENAADLVGGVRLQQTEAVLANVLLDLAQSGHMRASEDAALHVLGGLKRVGNNHKPNIERANFAVLRTSDMPAMLVETAFISNPDEEKRLTDPAFQRKVAGAVLEGITTYFSRQPPPGTLFAMRAEADLAAAGGAGGTP
ncbi:N-acetylmuramoyl-L-alanine amidase [Pseudoxanthomonas sp. SGNA-20]|uniref:N-acetylmuramoyl-L-alanine amidase n=1 Tax=Pseudoxanthomonas sp. SGNA-20 TaxID=2493088 RepID=UPI000F637EB2|nr:N-acetylmuramoyl-L-alanine amidase [Pseudoxanthomonas sp. SGNA-20]RRN55944.1 N-acetylmuramoyl-L-alanine amidase [Pseudoxanthomonas sp. SGNA-20]RRN79218.1 N-acetylmuramoyl-L-alanine amidase [Pseudoxanthomonas sp. SGD-10]